MEPLAARQTTMVSSARRRRGRGDRPVAAANRATIQDTAGASSGIKPEFQTGEGHVPPSCHRPGNPGSIVPGTASLYYTGPAPSVTQAYHEPLSYHIAGISTHQPQDACFPGAEGGSMVAASPPPSSRPASSARGPVRDRRPGSRVAPYASQDSLRHKLTRSRGSPTQIESNDAANAGYYAHVPPTQGGWSGEQSAEIPSAVPGPGQQVELPFSHISQPPTSDSQISVPLFPQFAPQGSFPGSTYASQTPDDNFNPYMNLAQPQDQGLPPPVYQEAGAYHQAQSYPNYEMGGGEFFPSGLVPGEAKSFLGLLQDGEQSNEDEQQGSAGIDTPNARPYADQYDFRTDGDQPALNNSLPVPVSMTPVPSNTRQSSRSAMSEPMGSNQHDGNPVPYGAPPILSSMSSDAMELSDTGSRQILVPTTSRKNAKNAKKKRGIQNKRGAFAMDERLETAQTRKDNACLRCRAQKIRCRQAASAPNGQPSCEACLSFNRESKKTIRHIPCHRGKLIEAVFFRSGGLGLTRRWSGTQMVDVPAENLGNPQVAVLTFTQGLCEVPITAKVVRFKIREGDVTWKTWTVRESVYEVRKKRELPPYCLLNIQTTATEFATYINKHAVNAWLFNIAPRGSRAGYKVPTAMRGVVDRTYEMAANHFFTLQDNHIASPGVETTQELKLMTIMFRFWFSMRHTTGTSWILGNETLGMKPETKDQHCPAYSKVSMPRMIRAQFDSINDQQLKLHFGELMAILEQFYMKDRPCWLTVYLCTFILLREASWMSQDRYRHARENYGSKIRYSIPTFVQDLQEGCNTVLCHWHYYNRNTWPDPAKPWERQKHPSSALTSEQYDLIMETQTDPKVQRQLAFWTRYKENNGSVERPESAAAQQQDSSKPEYAGSQTCFDWDHSLYWVSQMFEDKWYAHPTYKAEEIPAENATAEAPRA